MPTEDPKKIDDSQRETDQTAKERQLSDDDLKVVSGGLTSLGATVKPVCCVTSFSQ